MNYVVISDFTSALVAAIGQSVHHGGHVGMEAGYQFVSSVVGRWLAAYSGALGLNDQLRDAVGVFLTRAVLAMVWHERRAGVKAFDAVLYDRVGLLLASVFPGALTPGIFSEMNPYRTSMTGPIAGGGSTT